MSRIRVTDELDKKDGQVVRPGQVWESKSRREEGRRLFVQEILPEGRVELCPWFALNTPKRSYRRTHMSLEALVKKFTPLARG